MAYVGITNQVIQTGVAGEFFFALKEAMKLAGWTVLGSGTGTGGTFNNREAGNFVAAVDLVTTTTLFSNPGAWVRLREPGIGTREYIFHRGTAAAIYYSAVHYSRATGYTQGSPNATVIPHTGTSGDGVMCSSVQHAVEGITNTAPSSLIACYYAPGSGAGYTQAVASTTPVNGVYGFWAWQYTAPTGTINSFICTEGLAPGSTNSEDQDPSYRITGYSQASYPLHQIIGSAYLGYWEAYGLGAKATCKRGYITINSNSSGTAQFPIIAGLDPYTSKASFYPFMVTAGTWPKGYSTGLMWGTTTQNPMDVFNISSDEPRVYLGSIQGLSVPWIKNIIPLM